MIRGKNILLGISGSIAAYKSILLVRDLVKEGAEVQVICTPSALDFVTPITLSTLSNRPMLSEFITNSNTGEWANHVKLGKWADLMIFAPLSANTLGKMVTGVCDNLLLATYLSADCPIMVAPAMDLDMYSHWTTQQNLKQLSSKGVIVMESGVGELASGLVGQGRMAEPGDILESISDFFVVNSKLNGKRILITAGPTHERIDPVRFIGNYSTGKMGYSIAEEAQRRGAEVVLISGPSALDPPVVTEFIQVESAEEMNTEVSSRFKDTDVVVMSAAVADYRPTVQYQSKQKKDSDNLESIQLTNTTDILKSLGEAKDHQMLVGFALETDNELENGRRKLENKNLDLLVLNSLNDDGAGFGTDTNKVTFVTSAKEETFELKSKLEVAKDILDELEKML